MRKQTILIVAALAVAMLPVLLAGPAFAQGRAEVKPILVA
jgi:hypothetical protein